MYLRWYYEVVIDHVEQVTHQTPHIRIGWANTGRLQRLPGRGCGMGREWSG